MPMGAPPHKRPDIGQNRLVQQHHVHNVNNRADRYNGNRNSDKLDTIRSPNLSRGATTKQVNQSPHIRNQQDFDDRDQNGHDTSYSENTPKRRGIIPQKSTQRLRRGVVFWVGDIGVDQLFKEAKHRDDL